jgi:hypothetical protein
MAEMGQALCRGNDTAAGIELLEEAVAGSTAVLGADHPDTQHAQETLDWAKSDDDDDDDEGDGDGDAAAAAAAEEEEEETIATRVHKRRRHA